MKTIEVRLEERLTLEASHANLAFRICLPRVESFKEFLELEALRDVFWFAVEHEKRRGVGPVLRLEKALVSELLPLQKEAN